MSDPIDRNVLMDALKTIQGCLPSTPCIVNNDIHLCDSCKYSYPSCPSSKFDVIFGDSVGHDNICACNKYQPRYDEEWRKMHYESSYSQGFLEGVKMCEQAQPEQRWIPCSERLPKAGVRYQVTFESGEVGYADFRNKIFLMDGSAIENVWETERYYEDDGKVLAWMPLPEPYAERTEE